MAIPDIALETNFSQRTACVLVCDGSTSMASKRKDSRLNEGLETFANDLKADDEASQRVQVAVIRFGDHGSAKILTPWRDAMEFVAPKIKADGSTPLGQAVDLAMRELETQKAAYREHGIAYTRPWLWVLSDGQPTDEWKAVADRCRQDEIDGKFIVWPVGIGDDADLGVLAKFAAERPAVKVEAVNFKDMFLWLSSSLKVMSQSSPGTQAQLPLPGWTQASS